LLPGTVLCHTYGSIEKSYEAAASYGTKIESGKLKMESEELKKDKVTAAKADTNERTSKIETKERGFAIEQSKTERVRKLKGKRKKGNKKVSKSVNKREKRIRGKP
jgi:hypothetical protein